MKKEVHIIKGEGCDLYPGNSIHVVNIDENGIRWTKGGRDTIHSSVESKKNEWPTPVSFCLNCENVFTIDGSNEFVAQEKGGKICKRCNEKRTILDRN